MPCLLNMIYAMLLAVCSPFLLYRSIRSGRYREGWREKFLGQAPLRIGDRPCVWFHAVSVGEVLLLKSVIGELQRRRPNWEVVISTTTRTGLTVARRSYPELVTFLRSPSTSRGRSIKRLLGSVPASWLWWS